MSGRRRRRVSAGTSVAIAAAIALAIAAVASAVEAPSCYTTVHVDQPLAFQKSADQALVDVAARAARHVTMVPADSTDAIQMAEFGSAANEARQATAEARNGVTMFVSADGAQFELVETPDGWAVVGASVPMPPAVCEER